MALREALTNVENIGNPGRKQTQTYGRKKVGGYRPQQAHQDIFGNDNNDIENRFARLTIDPYKTTKTPSAEANTRQIKLECSGKSEVITTTSKPSRDLLETDSTTQSQSGSFHYEKLLDLSSSDSIEPFSGFGNKLSKLFAIEKVGEGSFAEVFKISSFSTTLLPGHQGQPGLFKRAAKPSPCTFTDGDAAQSYTSIIKIIPLACPSTPVEILDRCSSVDSVSHEINILKQLDPVHGFTRFRGVRLVQGAWPTSFLKAYREFRKNHRKRAINAPPDQDFDDQQVYALVEMDDAGSEISLIKRPSVFQVWDIFWISVILLANAEECIEFEHRDLHMSNICVKTARNPVTNLINGYEKDSDSQKTRTTSMATAPNTAEQLQSELDIKQDLLVSLDERPKNLIGLSDLRVTVIDYTVARACLSPTDMEQSPSKAPKSRFALTRRSVSSHSGIDDARDIIFDSMAFTSDPFSPNLDDIESHIQNLTYKKTRAMAKLNEEQATPSLSTSEQIRNRTKLDKWHAFMPKTNVVWLGYLLRMLIHRARGRTGKLHFLKGRTGKHGNAKLIKQLQESMWSTLMEVSQVLNGSDHTEFEKQHHKSTGTKCTGDEISSDSHTRAEQSSEEPTWTEAELTDLPGSSLVVLEMAVQTGWLGAEDIQAFRTQLEEENS